MAAKERAKKRKTKFKRFRKLAARWKRLWKKAKAKVRENAKRRAANKDRVSEHFRIQEFACNDGTPAPAANRRACERLARQVLEPLRDKFGPCHIHSGYRHRAYNTRIGGATQSYHIYDLRPSCAATDVTFQRGTPSQWASAARALGKGGVGQYDRSGFIHVDNGPRRDWWG